MAYPISRQQEILMWRSQRFVSDYSSCSASVLLCDEVDISKYRMKAVL
jgi:hypothetical protein